MCYNADIQILTSGNTACLTGSPTVQYHPKEMPTAVEISLDSERYGKPIHKKRVMQLMSSHREAFNVRNLKV